MSRRGWKIPFEGLYLLKSTGRMVSYRDNIKLLRIPFSLFLLPIYLFALSNVPAQHISLYQAILVFVIIHLFVYPASNGYNSYFDRDEESIGGLKHPPKVSKELFTIVVLLDVLSVALSLLISVPFALLIVIYLFVSKAYSYDKIRLKKYPVISTVVVTFFQGAFTFFLVQFGSGVPMGLILEPHNLTLALVSTLFLAGSYPLTQVYQHEEDGRRGDLTISRMLGVNGTFAFSAASLLLATALLVWAYLKMGQVQNILLFLFFSIPVVVVFGQWLVQVRKDRRAVSFENTMRMNKTSSLCLGLAFLAIVCWRLFM
jgi:4-hydroxybenzoate polyprenyltransferase